MNQEPVLSRDILEGKFLNNPLTPFSGIFQLLNLRFRKDDKKDIIEVDLSDGVFYRQFVSLGGDKEKLRQQLKKFVIIQGIQCLLSYQVINTNINYQIGNPIYLEKGKVFGQQESQMMRLQQSQIQGQDQSQFRRKISSRRERSLLGRKLSSGRKQLSSSRKSRRRSIDTQQFIEKQQKKVMQTQFCPTPRFNQIRSLNLFDITFRIRGRVVKKSELREYSKKDNTIGYFFNILIVDDTGDIAGVFFGKKAQRQFEKIILGQCYSFKGGNLIEKTKYTNSSNQIEIQFNDKTIVHPIDNVDIFPLNYLNFVEFKDLLEQNEKEKFDIICMCKEKTKPEEIQKKDGNVSLVQNLILFDDRFQVTLNLWDDQIQQFENLQINTIFGLTDVLVRKQSKINLHVTSKSRIDLNIPQNTRYLELHKWWCENKDQNIELPILQNVENQKNEYDMELYTLEEVIQFGENCEQNDTKYFNVYANLVGFPGKLFYNSCVNDSCKKKVDGQPPYKCYKCNQKYEKPKPRMIGSFQFADDVNFIYALVGSDQNCQILFGMSEQELYDTMIEKQEAFGDFLESKLFDTYKLNIKVSKYIYNDEPKPNYQVQSIKRLEDSCSYYTSLTNGIKRGQLNLYNQQILKEYQ